VRCAAAKPRVNAGKPCFFINALLKKSFFVAYSSWQNLFFWGWIHFFSIFQFVSYILKCIEFYGKIQFSEKSTVILEYWN
jgi:hypothetical protein